MSLKGIDHAQADKQLAQFRLVVIFEFWGHGGDCERLGIVDEIVQSGGIDIVQIRGDVILWQQRDKAISVILVFLDKASDVVIFKIQSFIAMEEIDSASRSIAGC